MNILILTLQLLAADTSVLPYPYAIHAACIQIDLKKYKAKVSPAYRDSVIRYMTTTKMINPVGTTAG